MNDMINRQDAIDTLHMDTSIIPYKKAREYADATILEIRNRLEKLPSVQPDNSCDGCIYENADDGVLVPCGFCKRSHPDNYCERRTDG